MFSPLGFLPFLALGKTSNLLNGTDDGYSDPIHVNQGIPVGAAIQIIAYVCALEREWCIFMAITSPQVGANGIISFGAGWTSRLPQLFPTNNNITQYGYVVAPFWSDNDLTLAGNITYQVEEFSSDQLTSASAFITDTTNTNFSGTWMLVAQWNDVHPYPHGSNPSSSALNAVSIIILDDLITYFLLLFSRPTLIKPLL